MTYVRFGISNQGPVSIGETIWVHWYLDDQVFRTQSWAWARASQRWTAAFDGLGQALTITPGEHTLRMVVDPGNTIAEADETNNEIEATFTWSTGAVEPPVEPPVVLPTAPDPLGKPNLLPYWRPGWGGPIMLSSKRNSVALDPVIARADQEPYIRIAITNESLLGSNPYSVDLFFDGEKIKTYEFGALIEGFIQTTRSDATLLEGLNPAVGPHTLRFVIDPENEIDEANEDDNVYELTVEWLASPPVSPRCSAGSPTCWMTPGQSWELTLAPSARNAWSILPTLRISSRPAKA